MESNAYKNDFHAVRLTELLDPIISRLREQTSRWKIDIEIAISMHLPTIRIVDSLFERTLGNLPTYGFDARGQSSLCACIRSGKGRAAG